MEINSMVSIPCVKASDTLEVSPEQIKESFEV
jgi:hypothetical protein